LAIDISFDAEKASSSMYCESPSLRASVIPPESRPFMVMKLRFQRLVGVDPRPAWFDNLDNRNTYTEFRKTVTSEAGARFGTASYLLFAAEVRLR
jgi:hypothetical protein